MRRFVSGFFAGILALAVAGAASAEPLDPKAAKKQLFRGDKMRVDPVETDALSPQTAVFVEALIKAMGSRDVAVHMRAYGYYGAIAVVPDEPISEKTMAISANLHVLEAAENAALNACNENKPQGSTDCVIVAHVLPKKFKLREFTLSMEASEAFRRNWKRGDEPKYLAFSPSTNAWAMEKGEGSEARALEICNEKASELTEADCIVGIYEE